MGNHKFKITSMVPDSWLSTSKKTKNKMTKTQPITTTSSSSSSSFSSLSRDGLVDERKSYYFTRDLTLPRRDHQDSRAPPEPPRKTTYYNDSYDKLDLPPIITKGATKTKEPGNTRSPRVRKPKAAANPYSPRVGNRLRVHGIKSGRRSNARSLAESIAVMKTSVDPWTDFKESMVEMIMANSIKTSKDLEDLLACYLSLNSDEYHDLIINVFKHIWFECTDIRL